MHEESPEEVRDRILHKGSIISHHSSFTEKRKGENRNALLICINLLVCMVLGLLVLDSFEVEESGQAVNRWVIIGFGFLISLAISGFLVSLHRLAIAGVRRKKKRNIARALKEEGLDTKLIPELEKLDPEAVLAAITANQALKIRGTLVSASEPGEDVLLRITAQPNTQSAPQLLRAPSE